MSDYSVTKAALAAVVLVVLAHVAFQWLLCNTKLSQRIKRNGYRSCAHYKNKDFLFGTDFDIALVEASKRGERQVLTRSHFHQLGKTFEVTSPIWSQRQFHTCDPVNAQSILSTDFSKFGFGQSRAEPQRWMGKGIMTVDGKIWKSSREQLRPVFLKTQISDLDRLEKHLSRLMDELADRDYEVDMQPLFMRMYLGYSLDVLFGHDIGSSEDASSRSEADAFIRASDESLMQIQRSIQPWLVRWYYGWTKSWDDPYQASHEFVDRYVDAALTAARDGKTDSRTAFIDHIIQHTGSTDPRYLRNQMHHIFFPARDTPGIMIGFIVFYLARHPEVYRKMREEVMAITDDNLTYETVKNLAYTNAVVNESLRLIAPASRIVREALSDAVLPRGGGIDQDQPFFIPKGSTMHIHIGPMGRDKAAWGEDAADFRPERWIEAPKIAQRRAWEYLPFSGGPRICPAQAMVTTQLAYILVRFAQQFSEIRNRDPEEKMIEQYRMLMSSRNGVQVKLVPADA